MKRVAEWLPCIVLAAGFFGLAAWLGFQLAISITGCLGLATCFFSWLARIRLGWRLAWIAVLIWTFIAGVQSGEGIGKAVAGPLAFILLGGMVVLFSGGGGHLDGNWPDDGDS